MNESPHKKLFSVDGEDVVKAVIMAKCVRPDPQAAGILIWSANCHEQVEAALEEIEKRKMEET